MWRTEYIVEGSGHFPFDMLRYDTSHPISDFGNIGDFIGTEHRTIKLCKCVPKTHLKSSAGPTIDRWRSFGWNVKSVEATTRH